MNISQHIMSECSTIQAYIQIDLHSLNKLLLTPGRTYVCRHVKNTNIFAGVRMFTSFACLNLMAWNANKRFAVYECKVYDWQLDTAVASDHAIRAKHFKVVKQVEHHEWNSYMQLALNNKLTMFEFDKFGNMTLCSSQLGSKATFKQHNITWLDSKRPLSVVDKFAKYVSPVVVQFAYADDDNTQPAFEHRTLPSGSTVDKHFVWHDNALLSVMTIQTFLNGLAQTNIKHLTHWQDFVAPVAHETSSIKQIVSYRQGKFYSNVTVEWHDNVQVISDSAAVDIQNRPSPVVKRNVFNDNLECESQLLYSLIIDMVDNDNNVDDEVL
jgi:hypothetical protein